MKINAICFTKNGADVIEKLNKDTELEVCGYYKSDSFSSDNLIKVQGNSKDVIRRSFEENTPIVIVGAMGIAIRLIADYVDNKLTDIPVIVMDEKARYVIPVLSGHVGGANSLANYIAGTIGSIPVITTATDINETFAIDNYAKDNRLVINNKNEIKTVSSKLLENKPIVIAVKDYPAKADVIIANSKPEDDVLWLSPKKYVLGIGCKKDKSYEDIFDLVSKVLADNNISMDDIYAFGSIDLKKGESGLLELSSRFRIPFFTFEGKVLEKIPGDFKSSEFVKNITGVDNICERTAMALAGVDGRLVSEKQAYNGVTVALALRGVWNYYE